MTSAIHPVKRVLHVLPYLIVIVALMGGAFWLGRREPPEISEEGRIAALDGAVRLAVARAGFIADALTMRKIVAANSQCIPEAAMKNIVAWADACVLPDCSIQVNGAPYVGIKTTKDAPPKTPPAGVGPTTGAKSDPAPPPPAKATAAKKSAAK